MPSTASVPVASGHRLRKRSLERNMTRRPSDRGCKLCSLGRISHDHKVPGLHVRSAGRLLCYPDALFDQPRSTGRVRSSRRLTARVVVRSSSGVMSNGTSSCLRMIFILCEPSL